MARFRTSNTAETASTVTMITPMVAWTQRHGWSEPKKRRAEMVMKVTDTMLNTMLTSGPTAPDRPMRGRTKGSSR